MKAFWNTPLGKDIIIVLVIKLLAVFAIWWFFFRPVGEQQPLDQVATRIAVIQGVIEVEHHQRCIGVCLREYLSHAGKNNR